MDVNVSFTEMEFNFPTSPPSSPTSEPQESVHSSQHPLDDNYIQLQAEQEDLQRQQTCLHVWNRLQEEIQQLHELFVEFNKVVHVSTYMYNATLCKHTCVRRYTFKK